MKSKTIWLAALLCVVFCLLPVLALGESDDSEFVSPTRPPNAPEYSTSEPEALKDSQIVASSYLLMERETGEILMSRDEEVVRFPASTTKIMTALVALQFCDDLDAVLTVSESAVTFADEKAERVPFKAGEQITLRTALYGLLVKSGNDAANVIAEYVAGDVPSFVNLMNQTAAAIGCTSTNFVNPHGLHDDLHYTTAHDLARIMNVALENETFREIIGTYSYTLPSDEMYPERTIYNTNKHINPDDNYYYRYSIGGKTGFTSMAGYCLVEAAEKDGVQMIAVILYSGVYSRWPDTSRLFEYGFSKYKSVTPEQIFEQNPITLQLSAFDTNDEGELNEDGTRSKGRVTLRIEAVDKTRKVRITGLEADVDAIAADYESYTNTTWLVEARAPIAAGEIVGVLTFYPSDEEPAKYNLIATRSVAARENAPPTLEEIQRQVEQDDSLFPPFSLDWALPPVVAFAAVLFILFKSRRLFKHRKHKKAKVPQPKKRYFA